MVWNHKRKIWILYEYHMDMTWILHGYYMDIIWILYEHYDMCILHTPEINRAVMVIIMVLVSSHSSVHHDVLSDVAITDCLWPFDQRCLATAHLIASQQINRYDICKGYPWKKAGVWNLILLSGYLKMSLPTLRQTHLEVSMAMGVPRVIIHFERWDSP